MAECPICFDPLDARGRAFYGGACGHAFHVKCLNTSVEAGNAPTCPLCRQAWEDGCVVVTVDKAKLSAENYQRVADVCEQRACEALGPRWWRAYRWGPFVLWAMSCFLFFTLNEDPPPCAPAEKCTSGDNAIFAFHGPPLVLCGGSLIVKMIEPCFQNEILQGVVEARRTPHAALVAANAAWALAAIFGTLEASFFMCILLKVAEHAIVCMCVIGESTMSWRTTRNGCAAFCAVALVYAAADPRFLAVAACIAAGLFAEWRATKRAEPPDLRANALLLMGIWVSSFLADVAVYAWHPRFPEKVMP